MTKTPPVYQWLYDILPRALRGGLPPFVPISRKRAPKTRSSGVTDLHILDLCAGGALLNEVSEQCGITKRQVRRIARKRGFHTSAKLGLIKVDSDRD